ELVAATLELSAVAGPDGTQWIGVLVPDSAAPERRPLADELATPTSGRDAFLSALSHDLRSPLNACVMWLDVLALAPQPEKVRQAVEAIKRNLARQTKLISEL